MHGRGPSDFSFCPAAAKLWIASIDDPKIEIRAQYNPRELQIDKQVPWSEAKERDNRQGARRTERSKQADLEFNGAPKRSMQIELLFDGFELGQSVEADVQTLELLSTVRNPQSSVPEERRPHHCLVAWGAPRGGMRPFCCVIESLTTKYTMWNTRGVPLRATCTVKLKEAERMTREPRELPAYGVKDRPNRYLDARGESIDRRPASARRQRG